MGSVRVPVTYRRVWEDGFGARGWKLDCSIGEPSVIAATAETGRRIPTSVLVHDLLDHHLCGVGIGGHKNEAIALTQLARRTGSDPRPDIRQIIQEDILHGRVNGSAMREFLPPALLAPIPEHLDGDREVIEALKRELGRERLLTMLEEHFLSIGQAAAGQARRHFESLGLNYEARQQIGMCLQHLLARADQELLDTALEAASGQFVIANDYCELTLDPPLRQYRHEVPP